MQQKFFDSGDYNMAQAAMNDKKKLAPTDEMYLQESLGGAIPTPGTVSQRKASICPDLMHMQFKVTQIFIKLISCYFFIHCITLHS